MITRNQMLNTFGIYSDPDLPSKANLYNHVLTLSVPFLSSRISNSTCHNLCSPNNPPPSAFSSLLGLGLKFCPTPTYTTSRQTAISCFQRFRDDFYTKVIHSGQENPEWHPHQLYLRDPTYTPDYNLIPREISIRINAFEKTLLPCFKHRKTSKNLSLLQQKLLRQLQNNKDFLVVPSDKNLGPVILERRKYIQRCLSDHLLKSTYQRMTESQATNFVTKTRALLQRFILKHDVFSRLDWNYLDRYETTCTDPFGYFYALIKVHKSPWQLRPIVSLSGSLLFGVGKWLDQQLQPFIKKLPTYLSSSYALKSQLDYLPLSGTSFENMSMFTGDITAMYPNIQIADALPKIQFYLSTATQCSAPLRTAILEALELIMSRNCFRFGDTYWLQLDGTAMGAPPAPSFATLYYGIFELELLSTFKDHLFYLRRYIDDQFGIWIHHPDPTIDKQKWDAFQEMQQSFCSLNWTFSSRSTQVNFLDLTIHLERSSIYTTLYDKPLNLHLYIPWTSAHTPSVRSSVVISGIYRILRLVSRHNDKQQALENFFSRLLARGYNYNFLYRTFQHSLKKFQQPKPIQRNLENKSGLQPCFLHLPYHCQDLPRQYIQRAWREHVFQPNNRSYKRIFPNACIFQDRNWDYIWQPHDIAGWRYKRVPAKLVPHTYYEPPLDYLQNCNNKFIKIDRLIVAYSRPHNLKNLLFPRHVESKCFEAPFVSTEIFLLQNPDSYEPD